MRKSDYDLSKLRSIGPKKQLKDKPESVEDVTFTKWGTVTITREVFWDILMVWGPVFALGFAISRFRSLKEFEFSVFLVLFCICVIKFFLAKQHYMAEQEGHEPTFGSFRVANWRTNADDGFSGEHHDGCTGVLRFPDGRIAGKVGAMFGRLWQPKFDIWLRSDLEGSDREKAAQALQAFVVRSTK